MADSGLEPSRQPLAGTSVGLQVLDVETAGMIEGVCDAIVPGSARVPTATSASA